MKQAFKITKYNEKLITCDFIKITITKRHCIIKGMERQFSKCKKIYMTKDSNLEYIKNSYKSIKNMYNPKENWTKDLSRLHKKENPKGR